MPTGITYLPCLSKRSGMSIVEGVAACVVARLVMLGNAYVNCATHSAMQAALFEEGMNIIVVVLKRGRLD